MTDQPASFDVILGAETDPNQPPIRPKVGDHITIHTRDRGWSHRGIVTEVSPDGTSWTCQEHPSLDTLQRLNIQPTNWLVDRAQTTTYLDTHWQPISTTIHPTSETMLFKACDPQLVDMFTRHYLSARMPAPDAAYIRRRIIPIADDLPARCARRAAREQLRWLDRVVRCLGNIPAEQASR